MLGTVMYLGSSESFILHQIRGTEALNVLFLYSDSENVKKVYIFECLKLVLIDTEQLLSIMFIIFTV